MLDMLIVGGGYVGLSAAVAVKQAAPHLAVEVIEAAPEGIWEKDERASAVIAAASRRIGDRGENRVDDFPGVGFRGPVLGRDLVGQVAVVHWCLQRIVETLRVA